MSYNGKSKEAQFVKIIRDCYLYEHLLEPARSRSTDNSSLTDLVLTKNVMQVSDIEHTPLGKSNHSVITFKYNCYLDYSQPKERYAYHETDFNSIRRQLVLSN